MKLLKNFIAKNRFFNELIAEHVRAHNAALKEKDAWIEYRPRERVEIVEIDNKGDQNAPD